MGNVTKGISKAERRDRKKRKRMTVTGRHVFKIKGLMQEPSRDAKNAKKRGSKKGKT